MANQFLALRLVLCWQNDVANVSLLELLCGFDDGKELCEIFITSPSRACRSTAQPPLDKKVEGIFGLIS